MYILEHSGYTLSVLLHRVQQWKPNNKSLKIIVLTMTQERVVKILSYPFQLTGSPTLKTQNTLRVNRLSG